MNLKLKHRDDTLHQPNDLVKSYIFSLPKGEVFYDLGACVGTYSIIAFNQGLKVNAFEVDKVNFHAMNENFFYIFGYDENFKSFNIGIADKKRKIELIRGAGQEAIGGHHKVLKLDTFCGHPNSLEYYSTIEEIEVDGLDNLIKLNNLELPDHIKIDIDGSEYAFLIGAEKSLQNAKSIIIELYEGNEYYEKILTILDKYNFKLIKKSVELEEGLRDHWFEK